MRLRCAILISAALGLIGCDSWFGATQAPPLPGERLSVMALDRSVEPDPNLADLAIRLPRPFENPDWTQAGGVPNHAMHHLSAKGALNTLWRVDVGGGSNDDGQLLASPIVAAGLVYTLDVDGRLDALDADTGSRSWSVKLMPRNKGDEGDGMSGGGIAYGDGRIIATTGFAEVIALDATNGREIWRQSVSGPIRAAPTVFRGRVFVVTIANELHALDAGDGKQLWSHVGITETAGLLGGASPAAEGSVVIAAYSSGEIVALRIENGRPVWSDSLIALRRTDPISTLAHVRGRPVIDRDRVIATANSGRTVAIDLRTGSRLWERPIGSAYGPWVAGEFIYILSNAGELICLARQNGGVRWVRPLQRYTNEKEREGPIYWSGPVLAGDRLLIGGSNGEVWSVSPYTGRLLGRIDVDAPVFISAVVANDTVYILSDDAKLIALR